MPSRRNSRVNEQIREEISDIIRSQLRDPRLGEIVSVTEVDTTPDFRSARVYISTLGDETQKRQTIEALEAASGFLRRELKPRLNMRAIPMLTFVRDDSLESGQRLTELIKEASPPPAAEGTGLTAEARRTQGNAE